MGRNCFYRCLSFCSGGGVYPGGRVCPEGGGYDRHVVIGVGGTMGAGEGVPEWDGVYPFCAREPPGQTFTTHYLNSKIQSVAQQDR